MKTLSNWPLVLWQAYLRWSGQGYEAWRVRHPRSAAAPLAARRTPCLSCTCD